MRLPPEYRDTFEFYLKKGLAGRIGFGTQPALLVVDMIYAFTDQSCPLGSNLDSQIDAINKLLKVARRRDIPAIFSTGGYDKNLEEAGLWTRKMPSSSWMVAGSRWVKVDERLHRRPNESLLPKKYASCFFGTDLVSRLVSHKIDTLILTGCTTSGCIRATAVDSVSHGFHTIVVEEAVGDRAPLPHLANLFDIDAKYGDVVSLDEAVFYLSNLPTKKGLDRRSLVS
jgi:nicotinamidase-related amidase